MTNITTVKGWIKAPVNYTDRDGNSKTRWNTIGIQTTFLNSDGTHKDTILEMFESGRTFHVFAMTKKPEVTDQNVGERELADAMETA